MRFIAMHKTEPRWEAGAIPDAELISRVGKLMGEFMKAGIPVTLISLLLATGYVALRYL